MELHGIRKRYGRGRTAVHALRGVDLTLRHGSYTAVMGPSGSGKSTFLQCAAGLDRPTAGTVRLGGTEIIGMKENKLTERVTAEQQRRASSPTTSSRPTRAPCRRTPCDGPGRPPESPRASAC